MILQTFFLSHIEGRLYLVAVFAGLKLERGTITSLFTELLNDLRCHRLFLSLKTPAKQ
jgi:hypothetical protein